MSREGLDFSHPDTMLDDAEKMPDIPLVGIPDRPMRPINSLSPEVLEGIKVAILSQLPKGISTTNTTQQNILSHIQAVLLDDIITFERTLRSLKTSGMLDRAENYENAKASIKFGNLHLLLIEYWKSGNMKFLQSDIDFFNTNSQYIHILIGLFGEIILNDFLNSGSSEISAKVIARKMKYFSETLSCDLCIPKEIHPNFRSMIETEQQLLR